MTEQNDCYYIDEIIARSLRSLAGFCRGGGEYGDFLFEGTLLELLLNISKYLLQYSLWHNS